MRVIAQSGVCRVDLVLGPAKPWTPGGPGGPVDLSTENRQINKVHASPGEMVREWMTKLYPSLKVPSRLFDKTQYILQIIY